MYVSSSLDINRMEIWKWEIIQYDWVPSLPMYSYHALLKHTDPNVHTYVFVV